MKTQYGESGSSDLIVIIRAAGERTFETCRNLVLRQVQPDAVEVVNEQPFEAALRRTYKIGIQCQAKWTVTVDADVLLHDRAVEELIAEAERMPEYYLQIEGRIHDKLTGIYRQAGHRIYRTAYLNKALKEIPLPGETIRPESSTLQRMERLGHPSGRVSLVTGVHDYEQYYKDIYRKAFVHANKHQTWLASLISYWKNLASTDDDFRVALRGLYDGLMASETASIDTRLYYEGALAALRDLGMQEKAEIVKDSIDFAFVSRTLECAGSPPPFDTTTVDVVPAPRAEGLSIRQKMQWHYERLGVLGMTPFLVGTGLCQIGENLKQIGQSLGKR